VLGLGGYLFWALRARRRAVPADGLTEEERVRLEALLGPESTDPKAV
jgi:hypothetical protein